MFVVQITCTYTTMKFKQLLKSELIKHGSSLHSDNYDYHRYTINNSLKKRITRLIKRFLYSSLPLKVMLSNDFIYTKFFLGNAGGLNNYMRQLEHLYQKLEDEDSRKCLLELLAYKILGYTKVKLSFHSDNYWQEITQLEHYRDTKDTIELETTPWLLFRHDLEPGGINISIYYTTEGCYRSIIREHYKYEISPQMSIEVNEGDVVLDLGACYGDTSLYFADKTGDKGHVYSFEFIPQNIRVLKKNLALNNNLRPRITLIENPLWETSGIPVYFKDRGAGSRVSFEKFDEFDGQSSTLSIDDFVAQNNIQKVDFLKTDIEGAEPFALSGAVETIRRFTPKLAISIYHNMDDFVNIITQIDDWNLGYTFYLGHASINWEETILFCLPNKPI